MSQVAFAETFSHKKLCPYYYSNSEIKKFDSQPRCVDSFAKDFISNVMILAIKDLDTIFKETKSFKKIMEFFDTEKMLNSESLNRSLISEEISSTIRGLHNIQIGDSSLVIKAASLEENVKEAVDSLHSIINESNKSAETVFIDGQGDANIQTLSESSIVDELVTAEAFRSHNEVESKSRKETIEESSCFLRKIIEEMEKQTSEPKITKMPQKVRDPLIKEEIAVWEENEEQLIRIIEVAEIYNQTDNDIDSNEKEDDEFIEQSIGEMSFVGQEPQLSSSFLSEVSSPKVEYVEEIVIEEMESFPLFSQLEELKSLPPPPPKLPLPPIPGGGSELEAKDNCKEYKTGKTKKWLGNKLRKLLHFIFGQNKH